MATKKAPRRDWREKENRVRDCQMNVRLTEDELELIREAAELDDRPLASWVRVTLLKAAGKATAS